MNHGLSGYRGRSFRFDDKTLNIFVLLLEIERNARVISSRTDEIAKSGNRLTGLSPQFRSGMQIVSPEVAHQAELISYENLLARASKRASEPRGPIREMPSGQESNDTRGKLSWGRPASPAIHSKAIA